MPGSCKKKVAQEQDGRHKVIFESGFLSKKTVSGVELSTESGFGGHASPKKKPREQRVDGLGDNNSDICS